MSSKSPESNHPVAAKPIHTAPYGSWTSKIHASLLTAGNVRLSECRIFDNGYYWLESRPAEKGRTVLVECDMSSRDGGQQRDLLPAPLSVHSKAHEYGGGAYTVGGGYVFFVLAADQRIYRMALDEADNGGSGVPQPITPEGPFHYADLQLDRQRNRLICVQEDESQSDREAVARIVCINNVINPEHDQDHVCVLAEGSSFYSNPALSPNGQQLSYLQWNHPDMPWDSTELILAELDEAGEVTSTQKVAGGNQESIFQPQWSPSGQLYYVSDKNNWWNIYRAGSDTPLWEKTAEFATPQWVFGMSTYGFLNDSEIYCTYTENGCWHLARLNLNNLKPQRLEHSGSDFESISCADNRALFIASSPTDFPGIALYDGKNDSFSPIASSSSAPIDRDCLSLAQPVSFEHNGRGVHGFYYPPCNPEFVGPDGEKPPLIVFGHGGPTGATSSGLNLKVQYWTSRGFAILDVNYSGSTGYGRAYRDRLKDNWGILDVEDVCAGANYLVEQGLADPERLLIKGGSAGGYTVLAALTFHDTFSAGASHYGIGDLTTLARDTHKFESHYLDKLVGPWPQAEAIYKQRSPINHIEQLKCPVIFFQGLEDKVVPPNQAEAMVSAMGKRGIPTAYVTFDEEGHGFRAASSIEMALEGELEFYSRIFGFPLPLPGPGIRIDNLSEAT